MFEQYLTTEVNVALRVLTNHQPPTILLFQAPIVMWKLLRNLKKSRTQDSNKAPDTRVPDSPTPPEPPKLPKAAPEAFPLKHFLQVLKQDGDYSDALNFLMAFPRFQKQVVIIKDHSEPNRFYKLSQLTGAAVISIWDYDKLAYKCSARTDQYSLKIFAYDHAEEKLNTTAFNENRNCLYVRHLDESSLVMMRSFYKGESTAALGTMTTHLSRANAWQPCAYTTRRDEFPKSWVIFDQDIDRVLDSSVLGNVQRWDSNRFNPPLIQTTDYWTGDCLAVDNVEAPGFITCLQSENYHILDLERVSFPFAYKAIVHLNGAITDLSKSPKFACQLPYLNNFYIKYRGCKHPLIDRQYLRGSPNSTSYTHNNYGKGSSSAVFTMVNESWSPAKPYENGCYHKSPHYTSCEDSESKSSYMHFLANYSVLTLKGVGDNLLTRSALNKMRDIYWERDTTTITDPTTKAINIFAPELGTLALCSAVVSTAGPTPVFECPKLETLRLVSLVGSDTNWDLVHMFDEVQPKCLTTLEFNGFWWLKARDEPMAMTSDDLAFVAHELESLSVKGYRPDFVLSQSGKDVQYRYYYPMLKDLTIDITRIPLCASVMAPSPDNCMLMVDFFNASFPVIEAVSLVIPYGGSTGVVPQAKTLSLFVPPSVTQVQVSSSWFSNGRVLEINGLRVDQGKRDGVLETSRTGRRWRRSMKGNFDFARVLSIEYWENCCVE